MESHIDWTSEGELGTLIVELDPDDRAIDIGSLTDHETEQFDRIVLSDGDSRFAIVAETAGVLSLWDADDV